LCFLIARQRRQPAVVSAAVQRPQSRAARPLQRPARRANRPSSRAAVTPLDSSWPGGELALLAFVQAAQGKGWPTREAAVILKRVAVTHLSLCQEWIHEAEGRARRVGGLRLGPADGAAFALRPGLAGAAATNQPGHRPRRAASEEYSGQGRQLSA